MEAITTPFYIPGNESNQKFKFGYYAELRRCSDGKDLNDRIHTIVKRLGFSDYTFINLDCANTAQHALSTLPRPMLRHYFERDLYTNDMVLQRGLNNDESFLSSTIHDYINRSPFSSDMTNTMANIYQLNKSYGFYNYFYVPIHKDDRHFMLSVSTRGASPIEFLQHTKDAKESLILLCEAIEHMVTDQYAKLLPRKKTDALINPKPLRVLNTLANNDLTIEQVAHKLCISVVTANQHLKTVRRSLGVKTNYAAIKRTISDGLIAFDKVPDAANHQANE
jgi:DNA-binding CsgD family transcriptional regulator